MQGTVLWYDDEKGYGFITPDEPGRAIFVHVRAVQKAGAYVLSEGQRVSFDIVTDRRSGKPAAGNLPIVR